MWDVLSIELLLARFVTCIFQVNCSLDLVGVKGEVYRQHTLLRQNEDREVVAYVKAPARGLYALILLGEWWTDTEDDEHFPPHIATYLIGARTGAPDRQPYPELEHQRCGEKIANIR